jgi:hypothetical protein
MGWKVKTASPSRSCTAARSERGTNSPLMAVASAVGAWPSAATRSASVVASATLRG